MDAQYFRGMFTALEIATNFNRACAALREALPTAQDVAKNFAAMTDNLDPFPGNLKKHEVKPTRKPSLSDDVIVGAWAMLSDEDRAQWELRSFGEFFDHVQSKVAQHTPRFGISIDEQP